MGFGSEKGYVFKLLFSSIMLGPFLEHPVTKIINIKNIFLLSNLISYMRNCKDWRF
tara:strand:+ start:569 stop:736 length:168 start_codon:yes stop_codon:yes gene_type:complete